MHVVRDALIAVGGFDSDLWHAFRLGILSRPRRCNVFLFPALFLNTALDVNSFLWYRPEGGRLLAICMPRMFITGLPAWPR